MQLIMTKYRVCTALLIGVGFVSTICLLLNIPVANLFLLMLFAPGAIAIAALKFAEWDSITALLGANVVIYSALAFGLILVRFRGLPDETFKRFAVRMLLPVVVLSILACFPVLNPILPVGMAELARQERELQQALNPRINLQEARSVLKSRGIDFGEQVQQTEGLVFQGPEKLITAGTGDHVIVSRWQTSAATFPCGYDMEIILLFGPDEKMKNRYIRRFRICP